MLQLHVIRQTDISNCSRWFVFLIQTNEHLLDSHQYQTWPERNERVHR